MRPNVLNNYFAPLRSLSGIGPKVEKLFARLLGRDDAQPRIVDLMLHLPSGTIDRRAMPMLRDVVPGTIVTLGVTIGRHRPPPQNRSRLPYQVFASDDTGDLVLTFFHGRRDYLEKLLPPGELRFGNHRALRRDAADGASRSDRCPE